MRRRKGSRSTLGKGGGLLPVEASGLGKETGGAAAPEPVQADDPGSQH